MFFHVLEALLRLFGNIVSHGGQPREDSRDGSFGLIYPMRPGYFAFCLAGKSTWYFRSRPVHGKVRTITLSEMVYNTEDLLTALRRRIALPEVPRRKAHWWGG